MVLGSGYTVVTSTGGPRLSFQRCYLPHVVLGIIHSVFTCNIGPRVKFIVLLPATSSVYSIVACHMILGSFHSVVV